MLNIERVKNGIIVKWDKRSITVPLNSVYAILDSSDMVLFKPSANIKQVLFFGLVKDIRINGKAVTRDNVIDKFNELSNAASSSSLGDTTQLEEKLDNVLDYTKQVDNAMGEVLSGCQVGGYVTDEGVKIIEDITDCN